MAKRGTVDVVSPVSLARIKLEESQITLEQAKSLKIEILDAVQTRLLGENFTATPSLKINYVSPHTGKAARARNQWPEFYRVRYLYPPNLTPEQREKLPRYSQMSGVGACAYFPTCVAWAEICRDPKIPVYITEGELKAAKACLEGLPTVGLGGVWMWKSTQLGAGFLPELEKIDWLMRRVVIVFDSDMRENPDVVRALRALADELMARGAYTHYASLPAVKGPGAKVGLDDYLCLRTADDFTETVAARARPITIADTLFHFNEAFCVIADPPVVIDVRTDAKYTLDSFTKLRGNKAYEESTISDQGEDVTRVVSASSAWLTWPLRREYAKMTYLPGRTKYVTNCLPENSAYNTWPGWGCGERYSPMPKAKPPGYDVKPFYKLFDYLMSGATKQLKAWLLQWLAYPIVHPGFKMSIAVVFYSSTHGTGKTFLGEIMGKIYGKNYSSIRPRDLESDFNPWAANCQFAHGDEITGSDKRYDADVIKKLIDQEFVTVNIKHIPQFTVPDCANYYFTTNQPNAFLIDGTDRRLFVMETPNKVLPESDYDALRAWKNGDGPTYLRWHLENEIDLAGFNPRAHAPMTKAKAQMAQASQSDLSAWLRDLMDSPDGALVLPGARGGPVIPIVGDLFTAQRILEIFQKSCDITNTRVTASTVANEMRRVGFRLVSGGNPIRLAGGAQARYWAVRNREKWEGASIVQIREHLEDVRRVDAMPQRTMDLGALPVVLRDKILTLVEKETKK